MTELQTPVFDYGEKPLASAKMNLLRDDIRTAMSLADAAIVFTPAGDDAEARTVEAKLRERVSVTDFGASGANTGDQSTAINAAAQALHDAGGGVLFFPQGIYRIASAITLPLNAKIILAGEGISSSIIRQVSTTADGVVFTRDNYTTHGGGVRDLTIEAGPGLMSSGDHRCWSTGTALKVTRGNHNFSTSNVGLHGFADGLALYGCFHTRHRNLHINYFTDSGILIDTALDTDGTTEIIGASDQFVGAYIGNDNSWISDNSASKGVHIRASGGAQFQFVGAFSCQNGWVLQPRATGLHVLYTQMISCFADTTLGDAVILDATVGRIHAVKCVTFWSGFNAGNGLVTRGNPTASSGLDDFTWMNSDIKQSFLNGWVHEGGINCRMINSRVSASGWGTANTYDGIVVRDGVEKFSIMGCDVGNFGLGSLSATQRDGILIENSGSPVGRLVGNNLDGNLRRPVTLLAGTGNMQMMMNTPEAYPLLNRDQVIYYSTSSVGDVAAGSTVYLGPNAQQSNASDAVWLAPRSGYMYIGNVAALAAPGGTETFIYQAFKNGVAVGSPVTLTGTTKAGSLSVETSFVQGDTFYVRLITSAAAAATRHRISLPFAL